VKFSDGETPFRKRDLHRSPAAGRWFSRPPPRRNALRGAAKRRSWIRTTCEKKSNIPDTITGDKSAPWAMLPHIFIRAARNYRSDADRSNKKRDRPKSGSESGRHAGRNEQPPPKWIIKSDLKICADPRRVAKHRRSARWHYITSERIIEICTVKNLLSITMRFNRRNENHGGRGEGGGGRGRVRIDREIPLKKNHRSAANRPNTADIISSKQIIERRSVSKADQTRSVIDVFSTKWCCVFLLPSFFIALLFLLKCHERLSKFER